MQLLEANRMLARRLYDWSMREVRVEVEGDFPRLSLCHNFHVRAYVTWLRSMEPEGRMAVALAMARSMRPFTSASLGDLQESDAAVRMALLAFASQLRHELQDFSLDIYVRGEFTRKQIKSYVRDRVRTEVKGAKPTIEGAAFNWTTGIEDWQYETRVDFFSSGFRFRCSSRLTRSDFKYVRSDEAISLRSELCQVSFLDAMGLGNDWAWPANSLAVLEESVICMLRYYRIMESELPVLLDGLGIAD